MAALETAIANIYEPEIASQYFIEETTSKSLLIQSGIAASSPDLVDAANKGGRTVEMPFFDDLPHDADADSRSKVATDTDDEITPDGITTDYDIAVKHFRTQSWRTGNVVKYVSGEDPLRVFLNRYINWWLMEHQRILIKSLTGCFADATVAAALKNDVSIADGNSAVAANKIGQSQIEDTIFLLGDAYKKFTAMIMHSVPFKRLRSLGLIDTVPDAEQNLDIDYYQRKRVIVDDGMPKVAGDTGYKYTTYLFGAGAVGFVPVPLTGGDTEVEVYRDPKKGKGAGSTEVITRSQFIMHPRGIAYTGSLAGVVSPSDAQLEADNWTQKYLTKNIRIAALVTNG